jgi:hypothetical protein
MVAGAVVTTAVDVATVVEIAAGRDSASVAAGLGSRLL